MMMQAGILFALMLVGHWIADAPLQPPLLSSAKRAGWVPNFPWQKALAIHAGLHAGMVAAITGLWWLGLFEWACHASIDAAKCRGRIGTVVDQGLHALCKLAWALLAVSV